MTARVHQELGHVEADAAGADQRDLAARHDAAAEHVQVADHLGMVGAGEVDFARADAGGQHHVVEAGQDVGVGARVQAQLDAGLLDAAAEVAQGLVELFLARDALGQVELAADRVAGLEQGHAMTAFGRDRRAGQAGRAGADHGDALRGEVVGV